MKTYSIPLENFERFERKITRLVNKAEKLGTPTIAYRKLGERNEQYKPGQFVRVVDVQVAGVAPVINGWQFMAKLEPTGDGENLVYYFMDNGYLPEKYRTVEMTCDHCQQNRERKSVYVVEHVKDGTFKQVGSTCLADFTGHPSPQDVASAAECILELDDLSEFEYDPNGDWEPELFKIEIYLAWVVKSINRDGWHSRSNGFRPTADVALVDWTTAHLTDTKLTQGERDEAKAALNWVRSTWAESDNLNDYQWNVVQATKQDAIPVKHIGLVASLVPAYRREMERKAVSGDSDWQGEVGKRQTWNNLIVTRIITLDGFYGISYMHKFVDANGNVFVWTTGNRLDEGQTYSGKATVKKHDEYRGIKQTVLTRAKFN